MDHRGAAGLTAARGVADNGRMSAEPIPPLKNDEAAKPFGFDVSDLEPDFARGWIASVPDFGLGLTFLTGWVAPSLLPGGMVKHLTLILLVEFIIIHSSSFLGMIAAKGGPRAPRIIGIAVIGGFYSLFAAAFSWAFHSAWPLYSFWGLMLNRMLGVLIGQASTSDQTAFVQRTWVTTALFYLGSCFVTVVLPIPALGLTAPVVAALHLPGQGLWISQPQRAMAFGFLYFTAVACSEIGGHGWMKKLEPAAPQN